MIAPRQENGGQYRKIPLQFFAKEGPGGEKTEEATTKKLEDARKEGQVSKSQELTTALSLTGLFLALKIFVGMVGGRFFALFSGSYQAISRVALDTVDQNVVATFLQDAVIQILLAAFPFMAFAFLIAFVSNVAQVKWKITGKQ